MNAICLITFRPSIIWCNYLNKFTNYKIFVIVDDNNFNLTKFIRTYNITFIQISNNKCHINGYINTNFIIKKIISGWDKALYYFGIENTTFDYIWFIEDDVFFYNENTIQQIDNKYTDDLLSNQYSINVNGYRNTWHWNSINIQYSPPYYSGMMCIVRFSKKMMQCIHNYATTHKTLFFLEALFPTIAIKNKLLYSTPPEFTTVYYRYEFNDINKNNLYHPIKNLNMHVQLRR